MTKPTIAIDIDDVLADYAAEFVLASNKLWGTNFTVDDYNEDWMALWGVGIDEVVERGKVLFEDRIHERLKHKDAAVPVLESLSKRYRLTVLTARDEQSKAMTLEWFTRHYPMIDHTNITFAGLWNNPDKDTAKRTKGAIAKNLGVDYIIDDQLKHCIAAAEHGITALLFGEYSWNQADELPPGITRVSNWEAVEDYFSQQS